MTYEVTAYDNTLGDPVAVLVATGTHDVSRLVNLLVGGVNVIEQLQAGQQLLKQVRRHNQGRTALKLLKQHGGPDLTVDKSADDDTRAVARLLAAIGAGDDSEFSRAAVEVRDLFLDRMTDLNERSGSAETSRTDHAEDEPPPAGLHWEWGYAETYPKGSVFLENASDRQSAEKEIRHSPVPARLTRRLAGDWEYVESEDAK